MSTFELTNSSTSSSSGYMEALNRGIRRARELGRSAIVVQSELLPELPSLTEIFAAAERRTERRFLASCPARDFDLLAIGCCAEVEAQTVSQAENLDDACRHLFGEIEFEPDAVLQPQLVGGIAFDTKTVRTLDSAWRPFGLARFTLPELMISRRDGLVSLCWAVRVSPDDDQDELAHRFVKRWAQLLEKTEAADATLPTLSAPPADGLDSRYAANTVRVLQAIKNGRARKVVLADRERIALHGPRPIASILRELRAAHPGCMTYAQGVGDSTFVGSTPEQLVGLHGEEMSAAAVAGTCAPGGNLRASAKDGDEHAYVVRAIKTVLAQFCDRVQVPEEPELIGAGRAQHLLTELRGRIHGEAHILDATAQLHPTPAVGGTPREAALDVIREIEDFDRGWYAGPIGWFDARGRGEMWVALRCGLLQENSARLYAGAGIVEGSQPTTEAAETRLKLSALSDALERACES